MTIDTADLKDDCTCATAAWLGHKLGHGCEGRNCLEELQLFERVKLTAKRFALVFGSVAERQ